MQACSFLLGRPWEFDIDAVHRGRSNKYTLLMPNEIVQCDRAITKAAKYETKI
jgi:hypothetical protein